MLGAAISDVKTSVFSPLALARHPADPGDEFPPSHQSLPLSRDTDSLTRPGLRGNGPWGEGLPTFLPRGRPVLAVRDVFVIEPMSASDGSGR
jgi:hypothetical protein